MAIIYMKKIGGMFCPVTEEDQELAKKLKHGELYKMAVTKPRNLKFHQKYFVMLGVVNANSDKYETKTSLLLHIKMRLGHFDTTVMEYFRNEQPVTKTLYTPKSISFGSMCDLEFDKFYSRSINVILRDIMIGSSQEEIDRQVNLILGFS